MKLDSSVVLSSISKIESSLSEINSQLSQASSIVNDMNNIWQGTAYNSNKACLNSLVTQGKQLTNHIQTLCNKVNSYCENMVNNDEESGNQIGGLW